MTQDLASAQLECATDRQGVNRRCILKAATGLGATFVAAAPMQAHASSLPKRGGHLITGLNGASTSDSLDPATYTASYMQFVGLQMFNTLTEIDPSGDATPVLAESWDARPGAAIWIIKLRRDVIFHNGKNLTAADVIYSINHHRKKDSKSGARSLLEPITALKATGKHELTVELQTGNADLPFLLSDFHLGVTPEGEDFTRGIGTGAYKLEHFDPGIRCVTKRNDNFWRTDRGYVSSIENLAINDSTARINALLGGSVQLVNRIDPKIASRIAASTTLRLLSIAGSGHYCFPMRCDIPPFNNNDLREAIKYAVDRESIVTRVLSGYGRVGNDQPIPDFDPYYSSAVSQHKFDPDRARFHFKKSGFEGKLPLTVSDGAFTGAVDAAVLIQASAAKAGISIDVERSPADGYWDDIWMKKPFCASYWNGRPTPDLMFSLAYKADAAWNECYWRNPRFNDLLIQARAELDQNKRKAAYSEMEMIVSDNGGELIPMFNNFLDASSTKVQGFTLTPQSELSGLRAAEKIWLSS